jgi:pyroglutamyl-peptidase
VLGVGLAGGSAMIRVERVAVNLADARIPDNAGAQPLDAPSVAGAPDAYFASLPVKAAARDIRAVGIPAEVSHTAGTFVCNHVFFTAMHATAGGPVRAGFVHVPWDTDHASEGAPALALHDIVRAIEIALATSLDPDADDSGIGGALD